MILTIDENKLEFFLEGKVGSGFATLKVNQFMGDVKPYITTSVQVKGNISRRRLEELNNPFYYVENESQCLMTPWGVVMWRFAEGRIIDVELGSREFTQTVKNQIKAKERAKPKKYVNVKRLPYPT